MSSTFIREHSQRYRAPQLPADVSAWPELEGAVSRLRRLEAGYLADGEAELRARAAVEDAVAASRATLTEAKLAGKREPKDATSAIAKAREAHEDARIRREASDAARQHAADALVEVVVGKRDEWLPDAEKQLDDAKAAEAKLLISYLEAVEKTTWAAERLLWLEQFPGKTVLKGTPPAVTIGRRCDKHGWAEVASVLKQRCGLEAPAPRTLQEQFAANKKAAEAAKGAPEFVTGDPAPKPIDVAAELAVGLAAVSDLDAS